MTDTHAITPNPTPQHVIYMMLDCDGDFAVTADPDEIADAASHLTPGYRVIEITVRARPPVDAEVVVDVPDEVTAEAASVEPVEAA